MALENLFGELANDLSIKSLIQRLSKFSFDPSGQLRVGGNVAVSGSLTTVTTVGTVSQSNGCIGDSGKTSAIMQNSSIMFNCSTRRNFI